MSKNACPSSQDQTFEPAITQNWVQEPDKEEDTSSQKITKRIIPNRSDQKRVPWTEDEHRLFLFGLKTYGRGRWKDISRYVLTSKTPTQIASHAQKYFLRKDNMPKKRKRASIHDLILGDIVLDPQQNQVPPLITMQQSSPQQNKVSPLDVSQQLPIQNRVLPLNVQQQSSPQQNRGSSLNVPQPLPIQQNMVFLLNVPQQPPPQQNRVLPLNFPHQSSPQQNSVFPLNVPRQLPDQQKTVLLMNFPQELHLHQNWVPPSNVFMQNLQERQHTLEDSYLVPVQYHRDPPFSDPPMEQLQERPHVQKVFQPKPNECLGACCRP